MRSLVVTIVGPDQEGIVESLSSAVAKHGATWVESRMALLAGQFAGIFHASVPDDQAEGLCTSLKACEDRGLSVVIQDVVQDVADEVAKQEHRLARLDLVGGDRTGIVAAVSRALLDVGVNVVELETECLGAPWSGGTLFKATAILEVPEDSSLTSIQEVLEALASDLMVEIEFAVADD
ncbi:MAG: glycine cleavage system protein R [Deltaproteobacteria bacterium]|nr:MAG: glycine cleavage system protein R [Deltaproteobacteria bacterium]